MPGLLIGPSLDAAVFQVVGRALTDGRVPYVDVWDHKPPVIYLVNALADLLPGDQWVGTWTVSVLATAAIGVLAAASVSRFAGPTVATVVACLVASLGGQYLVSLGGGLTEPFAALPAAAAVVLALGGGGSRRWLGVGVLLGLSLATSFQLVPALAGVAAMATFGTGGWLRLRWLTAGVGVVVVAFAAGLSIVGAFPAAWDAIVVYTAAYRGAAGSGADRWAAVPWTVLAMLPLVAPSLIGIVRLRRHPGAIALGAGAIAWLAAALLATFAQDRFYAHYAIAQLVPLAVLGAVGLGDLATLLPHRRWLAPSALLAACLAVAVPAAIAGARQEAAQWLVANQRAQQIEAAIAGVPHTDPTIWVWGNAPQLYLAADQPPTTRFAYLLPLITPGYATERLVREVAAQLASSPPAVIIDAGSPQPGEPGFLPLLIDRAVVGQGAFVDLLGPIRAVIRERYELVEVTHGWPVYQLTESSPDS